MINNHVCVETEYNRKKKELVGKYVEKTFQFSFVFVKYSSFKEKISGKHWKHSDPHKCASRKQWKIIISPMNIIFYLFSTVVSEWKG